MDKINDYNIGYIKNVPNQNNSSSLIDIYVAGNTINGYCYKDYDAFYNKPDEVCYIAECVFDETLYKDYVNDNKERLIAEGGVSTYNSIKQELKDSFKFEEYYYEYQKSKNVEEKIERVYSLDETIINATMNNSDVLGAFIKDESINMEEKIEQEELKKIISNALNELPSRQKEIIFLRYGFNNENPKKLEEIANAFGLTRQRINQIEKKAFERIRDNKDLKNYLNY